MPRKRVASKAFCWLSETVIIEQKVSNSFQYYTKFHFNDIIAEVGDFVLISNADSAEPDTEEGCDAAKIITLYEDADNKYDPYRAKVQWYSKPTDIPKGCLNNVHIDFFEKEVLEDYRPFDTDVSIETFFKKCQITLTFTKDTNDYMKHKSYNYICRYRILPITKRKFSIEPVLEEERKALQLLVTPRKMTRTPTSATPTTPPSLVKRMGRISISERSWSVSKNDGTKLLLKRAILTDKNDKEIIKTPIDYQSPVKETPKSSKKLSKKIIEEILSMELKENSEDELPTLIIRQHTPSTPKRKTPLKKSIEETPKKVLVFEDENNDIYSTRSKRATRSIITYKEPEISPIKRTPQRRARNVSEDNDDFMLTPKSQKTPCTPKTPRNRGSITRTPKSVRRILTKDLTPTLHTRTHSLNNVDENQLEEILTFVRSRLLANRSGCMYISGMPGTGKTATVNTALKILKEEADLPEFQLVEINGMRIAEPRQAYVQIYKQLTGKTVVWEQASTLLNKRFTNPGPRRTPTVLLVDEWAANKTALLSVLAVANTMDLPERALAARVASRFGLIRLTFESYTYTQLQCIVATKLAGANVTALELAGDKQAGLKEVQGALEEAASTVAVRAIRNCSPAEKLMLRAVAAEVERTGSEETTLTRALMTAAAIVALDGRPYRSAPNIRAPTPSQAFAICSRLAADNLLLLHPKPSEPRLLLVCTADDVHYGTRQITV
ncbi:unnamed protein product [Leptidea sinapis]|uniref:Origin recognition complex subunit 1 n=1 Tax=Leptidea sinapis TaxID=189913 RepID=A0A5E4Q4T9_9NEOP|nr:unnamed protein product [Leptidea sinapis]